jgi:hypothetical protein
MSDLSTDAREHDLLHVLARAVTGALVAEAGGLALLVAIAREPLGSALSPATAFALGFALGVGAAYGLADAVAARRGVVVGLAVGVAAAILAPLGAVFVQALVAVGSADEATTAVVATARTIRGPWLAVLTSGALLVHGPPIVLRRGGVGLAGQVAATAWGAALWSLALAPHAEWFRHIPLWIWWALLAERAVALPLGLALGDRAGALVSRLARGAPAARSMRSPGRRRLAPLVTLVPLALGAWVALAPLPTGSALVVLELWTGAEAAPEGDLGGPVLDLPNTVGWLKLPCEDKSRVAEARLRARAARGDWREKLELAAFLGSRGRYDEGIVWLRRAAASGDPIAMQMLGKVLAFGYGWGGPRAVEVRREGVRWLWRAALADGDTFFLAAAQCAGVPGAPSLAEVERFERAFWGAPSSPKERLERTERPRAR